MLYQAQDFRTAKRRALVCKIIIAVLAVLMVAAGMIPMLAARNQMLSTLSSIVVAMLLAFLYGTLLSPQICYQRFMRQAEEGIRHTFTGAFLDEGGESLRDGVRFVALRFVESEDEEPRRCYIDTTLLPHTLVEGVSYDITHTGNSILSIEPSKKLREEGV